MWFKLTYSLSDMFIQMRADSPPAFQIDISDGKQIILSPNKNERVPNSILCDALIDRKLSPEIERMFEQLDNRILPIDDSSSIELPYKLSFDTEIDVSGKIPGGWGIPLDILPEEFQTVDREIAHELSEIMTSFIKTLRWVQRTSGRHHPFAHVSFKWSSDKSRWQSMPHGYSVQPIETRGVVLTIESIDEVLKIWKSGEREPLSHELIREAIGISLSNPRSALLIGISALETGLKEYIQFRIPNSNLILANMPSPPALTMLQEVIPALHRTLSLEFEKLPLKKNDSDYLRKWIVQRNQIAHGLKVKIDSDDLSSFLRFVRTWLYEFDVLRGREWAATHTERNNEDTIII